MPRTVGPLIQCGLRPLFGVVLCSQLYWPAFAVADTAYDQMVLDARAGHYTPALTLLRQLPAEQASTAQISDYLQIASWAGLDTEVVKVYETQGRHRNLPVQALSATARAYRNLKRWDSAAELYRQALLIDPQNPDLQLGLALTQADAGKPDEAVNRARAMVAAKPEDPTRRMALGYALTRANNPHEALFEYDQAFSRAGSRPEIAGEYINALQRARLPEPALRLARLQPGLIDRGVQRRLEGDVAAERVRLADMASRSEKERFVIADRALADYDKLLATWTPVAEAHDDVLRWRIDRMGALNARARRAEVIAEYQKLIAEGVSIPTYALRWVASSYLEQREPEIAVDLYRRVLSAPDADVADRFEDSTALYYALLESERSEEARAWAEDLAKSQRPRVELKGLPIGNPNDEWMDAQLLAAQSGTYGADLPNAEARLEALVSQGPGNIGLRLAQADLYQARDWPRRSESLLKEVEATTPRNRDLEVAQARAAMDLQEWRQLDALTDDVVARYPENAHVKRLQRQRDVHDMAELRIEAYTGKSHGGGNGDAGAVTGSRDFGIETLLYSPPIDEDWRLFGGVGYATGDFEEGTGHHRWQRLGVERRSRDMTLEAEVSNHAYGSGDKQGARVALARDIDDHWQYGGSLDYLSANTPLRALNSGIRANGGSGFIRWRAHESREWRLTVSPSHFSDGNNRLETLLTGREGLYSTPRLQVEMGLEIAASRNSGSNEVPYFNPKSDLGVMPTVTANHVLYRRYETAWSQQFQIGAGSYSQRDYGTGAMGLLGYGQRFLWNDVLEAGATLSWLNRPYDGDRESDLRLLVDLTYRF
ncbi:poly-beta-1,6 N-acetyl-D-glucosamine export porin PgaA [Pseudomonas mediterranea]|uniref:Biofilm PGA synthesis protein PgaA n=1 Tax=Pseudomonas mediterranea TaxID=183795 RepID=A0AAX2D5P2_9PSED|nr:poly-beta-1,6 N-acetyl-D-glucosamine export porin PgaA [Pseudomonas mediterranea]KGU86398.1 membrane protein [Pseudomonas mediterranea CFBP 5447]MBL0845962.1 poly-beta-1,6 N-acetyl-D-glucosamine export porin PgaA [Pseudomonas mediterranea]MDU9031440.1 poly-beta-1,6 N-acetyl-D-glucosamine export porin PgaA [Pseudomonas mediterranea]UZE01179.1 poly-beta-1,6 N-acetyl-D-glucosamine export porin PgaA [Pseudomonas mediterranea]SDU09524.1 biofilm PGA synthesis protein PgaA [Pseudomonas mediterrane